jgi:hypothetical protein
MNSLRLKEKKKINNWNYSIKTFKGGSMWELDSENPNKVKFEFDEMYTFTVEVVRGIVQLRTYLNDDGDIKLVFTKNLGRKQIGL